MMLCCSQSTKKLFQACLFLFRMCRMSRALLEVSKLALNSFFCAGRSRHTRFDCDWSSDVCSSDLSTGAIIGSPAISPHTVTGMFAAFAALATYSIKRSSDGCSGSYRYETYSFTRSTAIVYWMRSEERRVGKEGKARAAPDALDKKR